MIWLLSGGRRFYAGSAFVWLDTTALVHFCHAKAQALRGFVLSAVASAGADNAARDGRGGRVFRGEVLQPCREGCGQLKTESEPLAIGPVAVASGP